jgi:cytochrome c553
MMRRWSLVIVAFAGLAVSAFAQSGDGKIWSGVYSTAQAERGKANFVTSCERCHGADLNGVTGPSLKGARFLNAWDNKTLKDLYIKIRDTMPPNFGSNLTDENKLEVLAFILQNNSFPTGSDELKIDSESLEDIAILRKGAQRPVTSVVANFSMVQVVGCLAQGPDKSWIITHTSSPASAKDQPSTPEQLKAAASQSLGDETFRLVSVSRFKPDQHKGQKVEAKGLLYLDAAGNRLNVTVMESVAPDCALR